jgi:hypothetical protein
MYCASCGAQAAQDDKYCRVCGRPQADPGTEGPTQIADRDAWPSTVDAADVATVPLNAQAPAFIPAPEAPRSESRPRFRWILGGFAAAGVLLLAGLAMLVLFPRNSGPSFTDRAGAIVAPVVAADSDLDAKLQTAASPGQLRPVSDAADTTRQTIVRAQGALTVLDAHGQSAAVKGLLDQALGANLEYVDQIVSATNNLSPVRATAAVTAGQEAADRFAAIGTAPNLTVPTNAAFASASQLQALATAKEKLAARKAAAAHARARSTEALQTYVRSIDGLLQNSAETRSNLGSLITDIQDGQLSPSQATAQIASIINQRQDLQNQVVGVPTPTQFRPAADKLRGSIAAALQDDYAIQGWITAWYDDDVYAFDRAYAQHEQATTAASAAKSDFLATYNQLRATHLNLPTLNVDY